MSRCCFNRRLRRLQISTNSETRPRDGRRCLSGPRHSRSAPRDIRKTERNESAAPNSSGMIARLAQTLTTPELRHLISRLLPRPILTAAFIWNWSRWCTAPQPWTAGSWNFPAMATRASSRRSHRTSKSTPQYATVVLGSVDVHRRRMIVAAIAMKAEKLLSVLQHRVAIPLYSFSFPKKFSIRCRHL